MSRKRKRKLPAPPLSVLDKGIYSALLFLTLLAGMGLIFCYTLFLEWFALRDPAVIASESHASNLLFLVPLFFFVLSAVIPLSSALANKKPLFGNKAIRYGHAPWNPEIYPRFAKNKPALYERKSQKALGRFLRRLWLGAAAAALLLGALSLFGHNTLTEDYRVQDYNALNRLSLEYDVEEIAAIQLSAYRARVLGRSGAAFEIRLTMADGRHYGFSSGNFRGSYPAALAAMQALKDRLPPEQVTIRRQDLLWKVVEYLGMNEEEAAQLFALFDATPEELGAGQTYQSLQIQ